MVSAKEIPWLRLVAEGVTIVAGILLAFAIEAWWDDTIEQQRERELLGALLDDFRNSKDEIAKWNEFHVAVQTSNSRLLQASVTNNNQLSEGEIDRLLLDLSWWDSTPHFTTGALNSIIFGGDLTIIQDNELRRMLAEWPTRIELVFGSQRQDYEFFSNVWMPFLTENGYLLHLSTIDAHMPGRPEVSADVIDLEPNATRKHSSMIVDEEFHNLLVRKHWVQFDILATYAEINELLDLTIQKIEEQLAR